MESIASASVEQVDTAVASAAAAFESWSRTTPGARSALLLKLADAIDNDAAALAAIEARNTGKPLHAMLGDEMPSIADVFRFFAGAARTLHGQVAANTPPATPACCRRDPVGVVGSIAPWNYPLMMAAWKLAPALAAATPW